MTKEIVTRNGFVKMWRVGPLSFAKQTRWPHAPESKGLWAFPWPFMEPFFVQHRFLDILPKRLWETENEQEADRWIKKVGKRTIPVREFWYRGGLYSRFTASPTDTSGWQFMDAVEYARLWRVNGYDRLYETDENGRTVATKTAADLLEVFIPPNQGVIRSNPR